MESTAPNQNETEQHFIMMSNELEFKKNINLSALTTFKIGGPARYFCEIENLEHLKLAIIKAKELQKPYFVLGNGSNLLVSDEGFDGLIIKIKNSEIKINNIGSHFEIIVDAGVLLPQLLAKCLEIGAFGLDWAIGIPGAIGGSIFGNAGAYGHSIGELIEKVIAFNPISLEIKEFNKEECAFNYRDSIFKKNGFIIVSAQFKLEKSDSEELKKKVLEYIEQRKNRIPNYPSAGCIFKNIPVEKVSTASLKKIPSEIIKGNKIPVGYLIEQCGLKGKKIGDAQISPMHANFIVNVGKASAKDVYQLIKLCKEKILEKYGIQIEEEIQYVGKFE